jgi:hypothetical protein
MRNVPNMYIINLTISDIIYLTALFSEAYANRISDTWLDGEFICTFFPFCRRLSVGLSAYSVAVLSIQRYKVTVNTFHVHVSSLPTWPVIVATICGVWIVAALFAVSTVLSKSVWGIYLFKTQNHLSTCFFLILSILCTFSLCDYLHLRYGRPPSCGKLLFIIYQRRQKTSTKNVEYYCKNGIANYSSFFAILVTYHVF